MSRFFRYLATAGLIAVSLESSVALTQAIGSRRRLCPLSLKCRHAAGHLIPSSQFTGNEFTHQIITHFFSPNPDPWIMARSVRLGKARPIRAQFGPRPFRTEPPMIPNSKTGRGCLVAAREKGYATRGQGKCILAKTCGGHLGDFCASESISRSLERSPSRARIDRLKPVPPQDDVAA